MTIEEIEAIAAGSNAVLLVVNCLTRHLEEKGVMKRSEFIGYLETVAADHKNLGTSEPTVRLFETYIEALRKDHSSGATH